MCMYNYTNKITTTWNFITLTLIRLFRANPFQPPKKSIFCIPNMSCSKLTLLHLYTERVQLQLWFHIMTMNIITMHPC